MELLRIEDLSFRYPKSEKNAVDGISLTVNEGAVSYTHLTLPTKLEV